VVTSRSRSDPGVAGTAVADMHRPGFQRPFLLGGLMKTPLDSISGTIVSGFVLTAVLYFVVRALAG